MRILQKELVKFNCLQRHCNSSTSTLVYLVVANTNNLRGLDSLTAWCYLLQLVMLKKIKYVNTNNKNNTNTICNDSKFM